MASDVLSAPIPYRDPGQPPPGHRCFFALARTRPSNTALPIIRCAVWNGFIVVCTPLRLQSPLQPASSARSPSRTAPTPLQRTPGCPRRSYPRAAAQTSYLCCYHQYNSRSHIRGSRLLPGVTNAETVHSLNLSTDLRYLSINCYPSTADTPFLFHLHPVVPPHHILNHVQARIGNHLDHMPILTPSHSNSAPLRARLHNARRPR